MTPPNYSPGPIACRGSFTGEFGLGDGLPLDEAPYVIERDRINEGKLAGFNRKLLPMKLDEASGVRTAGGYYLLNTPEQAKFMYDWYQDPVGGFVLDGIPILQRAYFIDPVAHYWEVAGACDFKPLESAQCVVRFERWRCEQPTSLAQRTAQWWPALCKEAEARGLAAVWLLFNPVQDESLGLVTVADRLDDSSRDAPDFASVCALEDMSSLGTGFEQGDFAERSFDRTSWIFSIWFPYSDWKTSKPTRWPHSPPFPGLT